MPVLNEWLIVHPINSVFFQTKFLVKPVIANGLPFTAVMAHWEADYQLAAE